MLLIILPVVALATYGTVLLELAKDWLRDPNYNHGFLIPVVSGYLLWKDREDIRRTAWSPAVLGLGGVVVAMALLILGTAGAEVFTQRVSLLLVLASLALLFCGWRLLRILAFPLVFLLFAIPLPYVIYYGLTAPLQAFAAKCAVWGLRATGIQALGQGNIIHLPQTSLEVAGACSGIRSLYAFLAVGALVAQSTPLPWWGRLAVFLLTIPLSVAGNAVRVWGSGLGATLIGPEILHGTIHEMFGLVVFMVSLGFFVLIRKVVTILWSHDSSLPSSSSASLEPMPRGFGPDERSLRKHPTSDKSPKL